MAKPAPYIRPEAYRVADHLLGTPLAKPSRRLGAMLIDLLLVAILVGLLNAIGLVIALVGAFLVFRLSRAREGRPGSPFYRRGLGCFGALLTFVALMFVVDAIGGVFEDDETADTPGISADSAGVAIEGLGILGSAAVIRDGVALHNATRPGERDTLADRIVERLAAEGLTMAQIRGVLPDLSEDDVIGPEGMAALEAAVETTSARLANRAPRSAEQIRAADSVAAVELAQARADSSEAALANAAGDSTLVAARDSIRALAQQLQETEADLDEEREERQAAEERLDSGAVRWIMSSISDELGLGLGWLGLYFTAFLVLGGGQTPGKRVFGLRVIRLDGHAIGWWTSLQRFGGYSASVFTGMLGFAEMFWDENRQALQDKLVFTVVIQEPKKGEKRDSPDVPFAGDPESEPPPTRAIAAVGRDAPAPHDPPAATTDAEDLD